LSMLPMNSDQASPIDMAPSCRGETRMPAVEDRMRSLPSSVAGSGAGSKKDMMVVSFGDREFGDEGVVDSSR
jgi:hypothetical protein